MSDRKCPETEITNMVMVENKETGEVLVQKRCLYWKGIAFPGGHIEQNESFVDSAVREVKEETGLDIFDLELCGVIHWSKVENGERYLVFAYRTSKFSGTLLDETEEGKVFWVKKEKLADMELSGNFKSYLPLFFGNGKSEAFGLWSDSDDGRIEYK